MKQKHNITDFSFFQKWKSESDDHEFSIFQKWKSEENEHDFSLHQHWKDDQDDKTGHDSPPIGGFSDW